MMRLLIFVFILPFSFAWSQEFQWITIGADALPVLSRTKSLQGDMVYAGVNKSSGTALFKIRTDRVEDLSHLMHEQFHRCAGFMGHKSYEEALEASRITPSKRMAVAARFVDYSINQQAKVKKMISTVEEINIRKTIAKLESFHNRYYRADTGIDSQRWVKSLWEKLTKLRNDAHVELFQHESWPQPSVILTIEGSRFPEEVIVIGGHADSINSNSWNKKSARAPGADDNASGIATITEVIKVMVQNNYQPERTIKFMGYAAEEVGLLGSQEIAGLFKNRSVRVVGVMQFDMTNNKGTQSKDIVMMSDYTNQAQNEFLGKLIDTYIKLPWGYSRCGYGCSDHASWTRNGYPASIPFESTMGDINRKIHSTRDTLENLGNNAFHAAKFAKLGVAYMVELAK